MRVFVRQLIDRRIAIQAHFFRIIEGRQLAVGHHDSQRREEHAAQRRLLLPQIHPVTLRHFSRCCQWTHCIELVTPGTFDPESLVHIVLHLVAKAERAIDRFIDQRFVAQLKSDSSLRSIDPALNIVRWLFMASYDCRRAGEKHVPLNVRTIVALSSPDPRTRSYAKVMSISQMDSFSVCE